MKKILFFLFLSCSLSAQTPYNYWTADNGANPTNQIIDSRGAYNLNYSTYSAGTVHISNVNGKVGNYIQIRSDNNLILASPSTIPLTTSFTVEFLLRTTKDWNGGTLIQDAGGAFSIWFEIPNNGYAIPTINFATTTNGVYNELKVGLDGIGRKSYGWYADGNWHHFAFVYNHNTGLKEIYVDGEKPNNEFFKNTTPGALSRSAAPLGITISSNTSYRKPICDIDEIAIYKTSITSELVQQHIIDINAGQHYSTTTAITGTPTPSPVTSNVDSMDVAYGMKNYTVVFNGSNINASKEAINSAVTQLKTYPLPRYNPYKKMPYIFNWCDITYMAGKGQTLASQTTPSLFTPVSTSQYLNNITSILRETTTNWNMGIASPEVGRTNEYGDINSYANSRIAKYANDSTQYPVTLITLKAQISGCMECSKTLSNNYYLQNPSGNFITWDGNTTTQQSSKVLRPSNAPADFIQDGNTMKSMVQAYVNALTNRPATKKIDEINENGEVLAWLTNTAMSKDAIVTADKNASGLSWEDYQGQRFYELEKGSYRDPIFSISGLQNSTFTQYQLDGFPEYKFKWSKAKNLMTYKFQTSTLATGDMYPLYPRGWRNITGAWNGIRHFTKARQAEIASQDTFFRPYVNAGFDYNEYNTVRPAQYLGMLKIMTGLGAVSFYAGYFTVSQPFQIPANWIWQSVMPSYAQATVSNFFDIYSDSHLLSGDGTWDSDDANSGSSYLFNTGDFRKLCVVRKWNGGNKYLVFTAFMNNTNMKDTTTYESDITVSFDGIQDVKLKTRRQGSVYFLDYTVNPPTITQLDSWHERSHPERWSKDIIVEAEMADSLYHDYYTNSVPYRVTEGAVNNDFTNSNSYVWIAGRHGQNYPGAAISFNIQRSENSPATRYFWIRARPTTIAPPCPTHVQIDVSLNGNAAKLIKCITDPQWRWYRVESDLGTPISFTLQPNVKNVLTVSAGMCNMEVDKIALTVSSADIYNATVTTANCSQSASITPSGSTTFCQGGSVNLTATAGTSYLWSTGATTQTITVATSGTYSVTVTISGTPVVATPVTVTVNPLPTPTITSAGTTFCQGSSITLTSTPASAYSWIKNGNVIPFETSQSLAASSNGSYSVSVTDNNGCTNTSNTISVTSISPPTAVITTSGSTTFCQGDYVTLSANSSSSYLWSNGATTQSISITTSGTFSVTVTNASGCTATSSSVTTTAKPNPIASISSLGNTFCSSSTTPLTATTGTGYTYQWQQSGNNIAGATSNIYNASTSATYQCVVTLNGCSKTSNTVSVNAIPPPTTANAGADQNICVDSAFLAANTPTNGTGLWTVTSGTAYIVNPSNHNTKVINLNVGTTVLRWTISNNPCTPSYDEVAIIRSATNPASVSIVASKNPFCNGETVTLTATPVNGGIPIYKWYKNGTQFTNTLNTYTGTFNHKDTVWVYMTSSLACASGSPAMSNKIVLDSSNVSASITNASPITICNGDTAFLYTNYKAGESYQWKNALGIIPNATDTLFGATVAGTYSCIITNASMCSQTSNSIKVTNFTNPTTSITATATTFCNGDSAMLTSSPSLSYLWSTGDTNQSIYVDTTGTYAVTVIDANGCSATNSIAITSVSAPVITITPQNDTTICVGGTATYSVTQGYTYQWYVNGYPANSSSETINITSAGHYYAIATNSNSCSTSSDTVSVSVTTTPKPTITYAQPVTPCDTMQRKLTSSVAAAYLWNTGETTRTIIAQATGNYLVTVANGACNSTSDPVNVTILTAPQAIITPSHLPSNICGSTPNQLILTASLASTLETAYSWSTGETTKSISPQYAGTYTVTVTNINGCLAKSSISVLDTCASDSCGVPFGLFTDNIKKYFFCKNNENLCSYARANWAIGNFSPKYFTLYYKNLNDGTVISATKSGSMRRAYMYNLKNNTNYQWWIVATCNDGTTFSSDFVYFKTK